MCLEPSLPITVPDTDRARRNRELVRHEVVVGDDVVVGTHVAGRARGETERVAGFFAAAMLADKEAGERDYVLRQQMKAIQKELGEDETGGVDATALRGAVGDLYGNKGYTTLYNFKTTGVTLTQNMLVTTKRIAAAKPQVIEAYLGASHAAAAAR